MEPAASSPQPSVSTRLLAVADSLLWPAAVAAALWSIPVRGVIAVAAAVILVTWALRRAIRAAISTATYSWSTLQWVKLALWLLLVGVAMKAVLGLAG